MLFGLVWFDLYLVFSWLCIWFARMLCSMVLLVAQIGLRIGYVCDYVLLGYFMLVVGA